MPSVPPAWDVWLPRPGDDRQGSASCSMTASAHRGSRSSAQSSPTWRACWAGRAVVLRTWRPSSRAHPARTRAPCGTCASMLHVVRDEPPVDGVGTHETHVANRDGSSIPVISRFIDSNSGRNVIRRTWRTTRPPCCASRTLGSTPTRTRSPTRTRGEAGPEGQARPRRR